MSCSESVEKCFAFNASEAKENLSRAMRILLLTSKRKWFGLAIKDDDERFE